MLYWNIINHKALIDITGNDLQVAPKSVLVCVIMWYVMS